MPSTVIKSKETWVWLLLASLTLLAWTLGNKYSLLSADNAKYMTMAVIFLAFFKVRLVIMYFMEIDHAPWVLRIIFELWLLGIGGGLMAYYFFVIK